MSPYRFSKSLAQALILSVLLAYIMPSQSFALGIGAYFSFLHGEGEIELFDIDEFDFDSDKFSAGITLDTNLAQNRLFNYRLTFGYQRTNREFEPISIGFTPINLGDVDADGFTFDNAFGLAIARGQNFRLWAGPSIRLSVDVLDTKVSNVDIVDVSIGGGPILGLNLHAGRNFTIGLSAAYQYLYVGEVISVDLGIDDETDTYDGHEHLVSANITFYFRTSGDQFSRPAAVGNRH